MHSGVFSIAHACQEPRGAQDRFSCLIAVLEFLAHILLTSYATLISSCCYLQMPSCSEHGNFLHS
jgi:hypothetical protein